MNTRKQPGELELSILNILQSVREASVHVVQSKLNKPYAYTTIMTVLTRMYKKGQLQRKKEGRGFLYSICSESSQPSLLMRLKKKIFGNQTSLMIQHLIESSPKMSKDEIESIELLIQRYKDDN